MHYIIENLLVKQPAEDNKTLICFSRKITCQHTQLVHKSQLVLHMFHLQLTTIQMCLEYFLIDVFTTHC